MMTAALMLAAEMMTIMGNILYVSVKYSTHSVRQR